MRDFFTAVLKLDMLLLLLFFAELLDEVRRTPACVLLGYAIIARLLGDPFVQPSSLVFIEG